MPPPDHDPLPALYRELRALAARYLKQKPGHTLQPTAIVNEAWLRLQHNPELDWRSQTHFFAISANAMRNVLLDHARRAHADKRGGGAAHVTLSAAPAGAEPPDFDELDVIALSDAMDELAKLDPRQARVVELRFFGGLGIAEIATELAVSERTVKNDWRMAKAWLRAELAERDA
ncbi:MAG: ECF-type sigma factor [bacterium]|nr:ECF-type sigma factor [bacterium]